MTVFDAVEFELDHNFSVTALEKDSVLKYVKTYEDYQANAYGSHINFYEYVDEILSTVLTQGA